MATVRSPLVPGRFAKDVWDAALPPKPICRIQVRSKFPLEEVQFVLMQAFQIIQLQPALVP
jgi:hypothetical protein